MFVRTALLLRLPTYRNGRCQSCVQAGSPFTAQSGGTQCYAPRAKASGVACGAHCSDKVDCCTVPAPILVSALAYHQPAICAVCTMQAVACCSMPSGDGVICSAPDRAVPSQATSTWTLWSGTQTHHVNRKSGRALIPRTRASCCFCPAGACCSCQVSLTLCVCIVCSRTPQCKHTRVVRSLISESCCGQ